MVMGRSVSVKIDPVSTMGEISRGDTIQTKIRTGRDLDGMHFYLQGWDFSRSGWKENWSSTFKTEHREISRSSSQGNFTFFNEFYSKWLLMFLCFPTLVSLQQLEEGGGQASLWEQANFLQLLQGPFCWIMLVGCNLPCNRTACLWGSEIDR